MPVKAVERNTISLYKLTKVLWAAALVSLPVTSFRYFPFLGSSTYVRPLSLYPLALLMPLLLIQFWRRQQVRLPGTLVPLGAFLLVTLATTTLAALYAPPVLRGNSYWDRALRAWVTVVIGLVFFMAAVWMNRDQDDLRFSVKWLLAGLVLDILWSGVQSLAFYTPWLEKVSLTYIQRAFSMRELVRTNRVSGMAYEPSWLAGQLSTIYLPWLVAAVMSRYRVSRFKWLEPLLLVASLGLLVMTYSRGGLVVTAGATAGTVLLVGWPALKRVWNWFAGVFHKVNVSAWVKFRDVAIRLGVVLVILVAVLGAVNVLFAKGYFARLLNSTAGNLQEYIVDNYAGARVAYAVGALGGFQEHPWTGVGLGASGFYIYQNLPDWALTTVPEIAKHLDPQNHLYPNPKNLYVRLLAETGIFGFALFFIFLFSLLGNIAATLRSPLTQGRFLGIAALFTWLALLLYNLTQDSFAVPNLWVNLGILTGMTALAQPTSQSLHDKETR